MRCYCGLVNVWVLCLVGCLSTLLQQREGVQSQSVFSAFEGKKVAGGPSHHPQDCEALNGVLQVAATALAVLLLAAICSSKHAGFSTAVDWARQAGLAHQMMHAATLQHDT